jgi:hypothetical protein
LLALLAAFYVALVAALQTLLHHQAELAAKAYVEESAGLVAAHLSATDRIKDQLAEFKAEVGLIIGLLLRQDRGR